VGWNKRGDKVGIHLEASFKVILTHQKAVEGFQGYYAKLVDEMQARGLVKAHHMS